MIEFIVLWFLIKRITGVVKNKGHNVGPFIIVTIALWFGGEFLGAFLGWLIDRNTTASMYLFALLGAACGAGLTILITEKLKPVAEQSSPALSDVYCWNCGTHQDWPVSGLCKQCGEKLHR